MSLNRSWISSRLRVLAGQRQCRGLRSAFLVFWPQSASPTTPSCALRGEAQLYGWLGHVVKEILRVGFWFAVLLSATSWIPAIIDSLRQAGEAASGVGTLSPTNAISIGINISSAMLQRSAGPGGIAQVVVATLTGDGGAPFAAVLSNFSFQIAAIIIVVIFAYIALQIIIALVEMYFVTSAGVLFIGMGGSPWTADFAVKNACLRWLASVRRSVMVMAYDPWDWDAGREAVDGSGLHKLFDERNRHRLLPLSWPAWSRWCPNSFRE